MKDARVIAARLEQDLAQLMGRLQSLAGEVRQHIPDAGPGPADPIRDLSRVGRELSGYLKRLRDAERR